MLKPIHRVACYPALVSCQHLMKRFALWLCAPDTEAASLNLAALQPPVMPSLIEADWLWKILQSKKDKRPLLERAELVVEMPLEQKAALADWVETVSGVAAQFQAAPPPWPALDPPTAPASWAAFRTLMEAFYEKGFHTGLPYAEDGTPVLVGGATYSSFVDAFRVAHRLNLDPDARQVCVLCGGPLGDTPHVDHWISKSSFPLLSMCGDNLTLICSTCNEKPNKGDKPVHSAGSFADWFHPYLRPGSGALQLGYDPHAAMICCWAVATADQPKAANIDGLLNLASRWTREFKAEYAKHLDLLRRRERRRLRLAQARHNLKELDDYVQRWAGDLSPNEPHHEVHLALGQVMTEPARMQAWLAELATVQQQ